MSTIAVPTALIAHPQPDATGKPHWCQLPTPQLIDGETVECSCGRRWVWRTVMTIGAFHSNNGLFFKRNEDGSVWVEKRVPTVTFGPDGETRTGPMAVVEHWTLTADDWASAVASVCKRGEVGETFGEALLFHNRGYGE